MRRVNTLLFLTVFSVATWGQSAQAQYIWNGSDDTDFTNGLNWDGGVAPTDDTVTASAIFNGTPPANQPSISGARSIGALAFDFPDASGSVGGWNLGGPGTLTLGSGANVVQNQTNVGINTISVAGLVVNDTNFVPNSNTTLEISSVISGSGISKTGGGTLILSGLNTYTGATLITRATVIVNTLADLGVPSSLGAESDPFIGKIDLGSNNAGILTYTGGTTSTNRPINIGGSTAPTNNINASGTGPVTFTADLYATATGTGTHTLALGGTNTGDNTISGIIPDAAGGPVAVTKSAAGKWVLSGASTYTGKTIVSGGTLQFNSIANVGGGASALGAPTTVANGTIDIGASATAGTLRYTGPTASTNRVVNLAGTTGAANIFAEGSGALTFTSAFTATGAGSKTLTLRGTNADDNTISGAIVNNSVANITNLTKNDAGKWVLTGASTYSGKTTITVGTLQFNSIANVGGGASALGAPTTVANGTIDLSATMIYTGPAASTDRVLNLVGTSAFVSASGSGALTFTSNIMTTGTTARRLGLRGTNTGDNTFSGIIADGATSPVRIDKLNPGKWVLTGANTFSGSTATAPSVAVGEGALEFNSIANVGAGASALGAPTTVFAGTILLGSFTINGAGTTAANLIYTGGGHSTDRVVDLSGSTGPVAIYANGSGPLTFTSAFTASQTTTPGAKTLTLRGTNTGDNTVGGAIVDGAGVTSLAKDDAGKWILGGANTYTGGTTVSGGTLLANSTTGSSTGTGSVTVNAGGTLGGSGNINTTNSNVTVNANAFLSPGASAGTLTMNLGTGSLDISTVTANALKFELGTPEVLDVDDNSDSDHVKLSAGTLVIGSGALDFSDFAFTPLAGLAAGTYTLFDAASAITGTIGTASGTVGGLNGLLSLDNTNFDVLLTLTAAGVDGDYNNNDVVDAADYVLWRMGGDLAHDPTPGNQDPDDYDFWRSRFGNVPASTVNATGSAIGAETAVPEPATCVLACLGAAALLLTRRRTV